MNGTTGTLAIEQPQPDTLLLRLSGDWRGAGREAERTQAEHRLGAGDLHYVIFASDGVTEWDTELLAFVVGIHRRCAEHGVELDPSGLPRGVRELLKIATAVPEKTDTGRGARPDPFLARLGRGTLDGLSEWRSAVEFMGEAVIALGRCVVGRARFRRSDLALFLQQCGAEALGIVSLISFLVGLILAFVGGQQLALFGATIFTADLVGIAMAREMAPIMVAIIMAGRTGAAFAAQLGTMTVNEEIDALTTFGIPPMEFLVLPRMLALIIMLPLLCLYADLLGMLGGALVTAGAHADITLVQYWERTKASLKLEQVWIGVGKSVVFGVLVALTGCFKGIRSGRSASAVGEAATSAVVAAIVLIIVTDAVFAVALAVVGH